MYTDYYKYLTKSLLEEPSVDVLFMIDAAKVRGLIYT